MGKVDQKFSNKKLCKIQLRPSTTPFNDRASQWIGSRFFGYNVPAAIARALFNPSTDAASLLGSINKKFFDLGEGFAWDLLAKWVCFRFFDQIWRILDANPMGQKFPWNFLWQLDDLMRR